MALALLLAGGCASAKVNSRYNRFSDELIVTLRGVHLAPPNPWAGTSLILQTEFLANGILAKRPDTITLSITSAAKQSPYRDDHGLTLVADGRPVALEPAGYDATSRGDLLIEYMWVKMPTPAYLELVQAKTLSGTIGPTPFTLSPDGIAELRELAANLPPEKGYKLPVEIPGFKLQ